MRLITDRGTTITLGARIAEGGEGAVFEVVGDATVVAKVYHQFIHGQKMRKLQAMVQLATPDIVKFAAWPLATLRKSQHDPVCGLLMRRISGARPVHELDTPTHRRAHFPHADWRFLVRTARNCAAAISVLHSSGIVIGDINQGGFLISKEATASLIDCDSFQLHGANEVFFCEVAVPEFLPPELFGVNLSTVVRTFNHDAFGLAVMIFRLLMMGRHPFAGYRGPGDKSIPEAIQEYRFVFGQDAARQYMAPPPHSLLLSDLSSEIGEMFLRAFSSGSERMGARPTAADWVQALDTLERNTKLCIADPGHYHFSQLRQCPWCRIEQGRGPNYFISVTIQAVSAKQQPVDIGRLWLEITSVPEPRAWFNSYTAPNFNCTPTPLPSNAHDYQQIVNVLGVLTAASLALMLLGFLSTNFLIIAITLSALHGAALVAVYLRSPMFQVRRERLHRLNERSSALRTFETEITRRSRAIQDEFTQRMRRLSEAKEQLSKLDSQQAYEVQQLQAHAQERQLEEFLDQFFIRDAHVDGIGKGRIALLESYGVETAHDVTEIVIAGIPGFGPRLTANLLYWRKSLEAQFRFNPAKGIPQADLVRIHTKYLQLRYGYQKQLESGKEELARLSNAGRSLLISNVDQLNALRQAVAQATADYRHCR